METKYRERTLRRYRGLMSRGAHKFKQGDVTKAIKGAVNAGLAVKRFEIDRDGKIVVFAGGPDDRTQANEWDDVQ
jgi:hypothetical protein